MTHRKGAIWTERVLLALILGSLIGSLNLIVALNRRSASQPTSRGANSTLVEGSPTVASMPVVRSADPIAASPKDEKPVQSSLVQETAEPIPPPLPSPIDPTKKILASLTSATAQEIQASQRADRRSEALEQARLEAVAQSSKWKRRELLVRQQIASLNQRADEMETAASMLDAERDVLAHERDALKAALSKASLQSGFAVLPYKGPNGTWRRPIVIECTSGAVKLQPQGLSFSQVELSPYLHPRSSPFIRAIAHELLHIQSADSPDGAPVVPYLVFLVRPDGIRPYYEARSRLEPLGIAFGYELIEQNLSVNIPDFDNLTTWDGSVPLEMPLEKAPQAKTSVAVLPPARQGTSGTSTGLSNWPGGDRSSPGGSGSSNPRGQPGADSATPDSSKPEDFVWPSRARQNGERDLPGPGSAGRDLRGEPSDGASSGDSRTRLGVGQSGSLGGREAGSSSFDGPPPSTERASTLGEAPRLADLNESANLGRPSGFSGDGSGSTIASLGAGELQRQGQQRQPGVSGSGLSGADGLSALPELEPAGDALSAQPVQPPRGSSMGQSKGAGGGQFVALGGGQAIGGSATAGGSGSSSSNSGAGGQSLNVAGGKPGGSAGTTDGFGTSNLSPSAVGQFVALGAGQPGGGAATTGGSGSSNSTGSDGGEQSGLSPDGGAAGQALTAATSAIFGNGGGMGQSQSSVPSQGSSGGVSPTESGSGSATTASELPALPQNPNEGTPPSNSQPAAGPYTASGPLSSSEVLSLPPQGSNVAGTALGSSLGVPSGSVRPPSTDLSSSSSSATTNSSSSSTSTSPPSSMSASGGMPLASTSSGGPPSVSLPSLSFGQDSKSASDPSKQTAVPPPPKPVITMGSIEVPFEIVVVCRQRDLILHPGGYRLTTQAMKEQGGGKDGLLVREIRAVVRRRAQVDPMIRPKPKITFLVESNGSDTFWTARRQLLFSLPEWPSSLQVSESQGVHVFNKETW